MIGTQCHLQLDETARELLLLRMPNEILNGLALQNFDQVVGVSHAEFTSMAVALKATSPGVSISCSHAIILRNALAETMRELETELQTRTGYQLAEASAVLHQLDVFISASQGEQ